MMRASLGAALTVAMALAATEARAETQIEARSPGGTVAVTVTVGKALTYAITFAGQPVVLPSPIELALAGARPLGPGLVVRKQSRRIVDDTWTAVHGKRRQVRDHATEIAIELVEAAAPRRRLDLVVRAYDDGAAFRYAIPRQPGLETFQLEQHGQGFARVVVAFDDENA